MNGKPPAGSRHLSTARSNALDTARRVRCRDGGICAEIFRTASITRSRFDTTIFVASRSNEVYHTLFEAGMLVLLVIMIFLQNWRATLVPATTVPVTIIGAFAGHGR